jgi:hypothetical protein
VFFLSSKAFDEYAQGYKEMQASHMPRKTGSLPGDTKSRAASMETAITRSHMRIVV